MREFSEVWRGRINTKTSSLPVSLLRLGTAGAEVSCRHCYWYIVLVAAAVCSMLGSAAATGDVVVVLLGQAGAAAAEGGGEALQTSVDLSRKNAHITIEQISHENLLFRHM